MHAHREWFARLRELGYTDLWSAEVDGADGFTPLALAAAWEPTLHLGVAITPAYTRGPALLAQSVAAIADAAPGRFACGLGASSQVIVANWNGLAFENQYRRVRDTLRFLKLAFTGEKVTEAFETFSVKGFRLALIPEQLPPIYLAALRPGMLHLAGREADGAILNWLSAEDVPRPWRKWRRPPRARPARSSPASSSSSPRTRRSPGHRAPDDHRLPERQRLRRFQRWLGRGPALQPMWDAWAAGDRKGALEAIPDEVVDELVVHGSRPSAGPTCSVTSTTASPSLRRPSSPSASTWPRRWRAPPPPTAGWSTIGSAEIDFRTTSVAGLARSVRAKEVSARELTEAALARIERLNPTYNAFVTIDGDRALAEAGAIDATIADGGDPGPLAGIPIGVKDLQNAKVSSPPTDRRCTPTTHPPTPTIPSSPACGPPAASSSARPTRPSSAGSGNTSNAIFGPSYNPFDTSRGPGGSSGGAAAALAAGMVPLATGSDGGGSIRIPSACCGLSGMKPSLGRVPAGGPNPPGWIDLSTNGPMARRIADVTRALDVAVGPDPTDLRALPRPEASWLAALDDPHVPVGRLRAAPSGTPRSTPRWPTPASAPSS